MPQTPWNCPQPAEQYKLEHAITQADFDSRNPVYLTRHDAAYVAEKIAPVANCATPVGVNPAGNMVLIPAPDLVYYPAGLFKAILEDNPETFEMFSTDETAPPGRPDVIMRIVSKEGKTSFYDMTDGGNF